MTPQEIGQKVPWKDLLTLKWWEKLIENTLTLPWLIGSMFLAYQEWYWLALPFSALFFLTGLRQVHNGFHYALGTHKKLTWLTLYINSILMVVSIHAVKFNHIRHHKYCLRAQDQEGKSAHMTWYGAILYGPIHMIRVHILTWKLGDKSYKRNMIFELVSAVIFVACAIQFEIHWLIYHIIIMLIGECLMAFFAVWTVHHHTHDNPVFARSQRTPWKNRISFSMFYHLEHHLFPAVPTIKLAELARRIDDAVPEMEIKKTF